MKLIEAFIIGQQEYGIHSNWKAIHMGNALEIVHKKDGFYYAKDGGVGIFSRSDRLEVTLAGFAEKYPYEVLDDQWKVSRWDK